MPFQKCVHLLRFVTGCLVIEISMFERHMRFVPIFTIVNDMLTSAASMVACWMQGENASLEMCAFVLLCNALHSY